MRRIISGIIALLTGLAGLGSAATPIAVCATTPDLGALAHEIGKSDIRLTVFARGTEDPHFVEARPSFLKALSEADLLVVNGLDLEIGWLPKLLQSARNARVLPGGQGYLDASTTISPLEIPSVPLDRSMGDVHPYGNPHYLLDPVNGVAVAGLIRDALIRVQPANADAFRSRWEALRDRVEIALVGEDLAEKYDGLKLAELATLGGLDRFLEDRGEADALEGWLGALAPHRGAKLAADHRVWPYFARRFGLETVATLEPIPGYPPTTRHVEEVVETVRREKIRIILASAYFDPRHAALVARETGAHVLAMANQVGARPGASDYVSTIGFDVRQVVAGLERSEP